MVVSCGTLGLTVGKQLVSHGTSLETTSRSVVDRGVFNSFAWQTINEHPQGVGIGNYIPYLESVKNLEPWQYQPPHNIYLMIGAEGGVITLIIFLTFIYFIFSCTWNAYNKVWLYLATTTGIMLLMGLGDHYFATIQQGRLIFFTQLGLLLASKNLFDHEKLA